MKILFVLPELYPHPGGGLATYYMHYIRLLKSHCSEIRILIGSLTEQNHKPVEWEEIEINYLNSNLYKKYLPLFSHFSSWPEIQGHLAAAWALYEQADQGNGFDVIETTDWGWNYLPFALSGHKNLITRLHGSIAQIEYYDPRESFDLYAHLTRLLEIDTLSLVPTLVTYSLNNQHFWIEKLQRDIIHIYPILSINEENQNTPEVNIPVENYALVIGRIQAWKGAEILCRALDNQDIGIPIYWIGRDSSYKKNNASYNKYLQDKYPSIWGKKIIPLGPKSREECRQWMQKAKFGIVPSTWDMFNLTIIEWIEAKKPIVCSAGAGGSSLLENLPENLIFTASQPDSLTNVLKCAIELNESQSHLQSLAQLTNFSTYCEVSNLIDINKSLYNSISKDINLVSLKSNWRFNAYFPSSIKTDRYVLLDQWPLRDLLNYIKNRLLKRKYL